MEEAILKAVWRYRYLPALDAMHVLGLTSPGHVRRLLSKLSSTEDAENQYLLSLPIPDSRVGGVERCYALSRLGRQAVAALGLPVSEYFRPGKPRVVSFSHLSHELLVNRCVIAASRAQTAFNLVDVRLNPDVAVEDGTLPAIPDAWLLWEREGKKYPVWLEVDNATEFYKRFSQLLHVRVECLTSGAYSRAFPEAEGAVMIAYAVSGRTAEAAESRVKTLRRWTMRILTELEMERWAGIFRFASVVFSEVYEQGLFEKTIWYRPDAKAAVPLFPS